jgi:hypothetical protein
MRLCRDSLLEGATSLADVCSNVCSKVRPCRDGLLEGAPTLAAKAEHAPRIKGDLMLSKETQYTH